MKTTTTPERSRYLFNRVKSILAIAMLCAFLSINVFGRSVFPAFPDCEADAKLQQEVSRELQQLLTTHKLDMEEYSKRAVESKNTEGEWRVYARRINKRIERISKLFVGKCLKSAQDYYAAAYIYNTGPKPNHKYQAFFWASKAVNLGAEDARDLAIYAIDGYLIKTGKKQLFGTVCTIRNLKNNEKCCRMLESEPKFPDRLRKKYSGYTLRDRYNSLQLCCMPSPSIKPCTDRQNSSSYTVLRNVPRGTIPGIWL